MDTELSQLLKDGILKIDKGIYNDELLTRLEKLYDEVSLFNPVYKLVGSGGRELVVKHILDCLAPVPIMKKIIGDKNGYFADLGSGAGFPGLVLSSVFTQYRFFLVEKMGRRAGFLRNTVALTGLVGNAEIIEKNLEELDENFDFVTFRAFRHMRDIASDLKRITKSGSFVFAYKSSEDDIRQEVSDMEKLVPDTFRWQILDYEVPFTDAKRSLLILERI